MIVIAIPFIFPVLGWLGTISYLLAYLLLTMQRLKADQPVYHLLNVVGAIGLTVNAIYYTDLPNVVVNVFWGIIGVMAILLLLKKKKG